MSKYVQPPPGMMQVNDAFHAQSFIGRLLVDPKIAKSLLTEGPIRELIAFPSQMQAILALAGLNLTANDLAKNLATVDLNYSLGSQVQINTKMPGLFQPVLKGVEVVVNPPSNNVALAFALNSKPCVQMPQPIHTLSASNDVWCGTDVHPRFTQWMGYTRTGGHRSVAITDAQKHCKAAQKNARLYAPTTFEHLGRRILVIAHYTLPILEADPEGSAFKKNMSRCYQQGWVYYASFSAETLSSLSQSLQVNAAVLTSKKLDIPGLPQDISLASANNEYLATCISFLATLAPALYAFYTQKQSLDNIKAIPWTGSDSPLAAITSMVTALDPNGAIRGLDQMARALSTTAKDADGPDYPDMDKLISAMYSLVPQIAKILFQ